MLDFVWALIFWQLYELLGLPLRAALAATRLGAAERRALARVAGPVVTFLPLWGAAYFLPGLLTPLAAWLWTAVLLVLAVRAVRPAALARLLAWDVAPGGGAPGAWPTWRQARFHVGFEAVCFALFLGFVAFRRWVPEMTFDIGASAAEKFMNQMLFWANWHAPRLPAEDYWFAGHRGAYYDWAHAHWAWAGRAAVFAPEIVLNLALARVTLATVEAGFVLGRALGLRRAWALGGAVAAAWCGNLAGVREGLKLHALARQLNLPLDWAGYDFWAPSRAIKNVVDEFPAFSAILGDFHAHHLALPWLLLVLALLAWGPWGFARARARTAHLARAVWLGLVLACALAATLANAWNLPLIGLACGVWLAAQLVRRPRALAWALPGCVALGVVLFGALRFQRGGAGLPLVAGIDPPGGWPAALARVGLMPVPPGLRSTPAEWLGLWGLPVAVLLGAGGVLLLVRRGRALRACLSGGWPWALGGVAVLLGALELVFLQDRFVGELVRYNSYFKFSYPAWPVLMLGAAAALQGVAGAWRGRPGGPARSLLVLALAAGGAAALLGLVYPALALPARVLQAQRGDDPPRRPTLNSVDYIAHRPPHHAEADLIRYIRARIPPGTRIAEGGAFPPGSGAYDYGGRIASLAGRPVPLGWIHHEQQWRGPEWFARLDARAALVTQLYRAADPAAARAAAQALGVRYVIFGLNERQRFGPEARDILLRAGEAEATWLPAGAEPDPNTAIYLIRID